MPSIVNLKLAGLALAVLGFSSPIFAQDGTPDILFGNSGMAVTPVTGNASTGTSLAVQKDNKIILGGNTTANSNQYFGLVRYEVNGKVDSSFGINGRVIAGFTEPGIANLTALKLQKDGKIIAVGNSGSSSFSVIRFNTDGTVDSTFGTNGRVVTIIGSDAFCNAVTIQPNGRILVAGNAGNDIVLCRYKPDGSLDPAFGVHGIKTIDAGGADKAYSVLLQADKKIIVAGSTGLGAVTSFLVMRCNINGSVDSTFGTNGHSSTTIRQAYNVAFSCVLQPDGKIVAGGIAKYFSSVYGLVRYNDNGLVDSSFGNNGVTTCQFVTGDHNPKAMALQADGKIVQTGWINDGGVLEAATVRYDSTGVIDSSFGSNGRVITGNGNGLFGNDIAIQSDAKILVGGYTYLSGSGNYFAVMRYNAGSVLPVKLSSFTATPAKSAVILNWTTATETGNSYFSIERSGNSTSFTAIGKVPGHGSTSLLQQYTYTDVQPLKGDNYYRLKQVDKDGRYAYSKTIHLVFGTEPYLMAYPNPAKNTVKIGGLNTGASVSITNVSGKTIRTFAATGSDYSINIQNLAAGIYFVRVQQGGKTTTLKVVKE